MKQCKATVWCRNETQNGWNKSIKVYNSAGEYKIKGSFVILNQNELPVPDIQGWIYPFNQPNYCTKTSSCPALQRICNLKTPLYNHKLSSPRDRHLYWHCHTFATILCSLSSTEHFLISWVVWANIVFFLIRYYSRCFKDI